MRSPGPSAWPAVAALMVSAGAVQAQIDGVVHLTSASHSPLTDRSPRAPLNGESFVVRFQTGRDDVDLARLGVDAGADGGGFAWANATRVGTHGEYDIWQATVNPAGSNRFGYLIELGDGAARGYIGAAGVSTSIGTATSWIVDYTTLEHVAQGATPSASGTVFRVWAPNATACRVRGDFNAWGAGTTLTKRGEVFVGVVANALAGQEYKYYFNNTTWKPDARGTFTNNSDNYNSQIVNQSAYAWQHSDFVAAPRDRWVVYQLHVGTFAGLNDPAGSFTRISGFRDVGLRAAHLGELGVNAVMLNPCNEFPGTNSGGYNSISQWSFDGAYGSVDDLKYMVDALHAHGIAVMLDVVWNHFSTSDNFMWNYDGAQLYFDSPAVDTPWGSQANFDRQGVYDYFLDSVELVLGEYQMDGYRFDALNEMTGATQATSGQRLIRATAELTKRRFRDAHLIGEIYNNSAWNTSASGLNLDGQYHEAYKNAIRDAIFAAASGNSDMARLAGSIDGSGTGVEGSSAFNYFELHDDAWPLSGGQRAVRTIDTTAPYDDRYATGRTKLANGLTILSRGMPAIVQGTEWLESNPWGDAKIDWSKKGTYRGVFDFYRTLIGLRTTDPTLFANSPARVYHVNDTSNVIAFERYVTGGGSYVVVANFSNADFATYIVGLPRSGNWEVVLNSEDAAYRGRGVGSMPGCVEVEPIARDGMAQRTTLSLPAHGFLLLRQTTTSCSTCPECAADFDQNGGVDGADLAAFFMEYESGAVCADVDQNGGVDGADLATFFMTYESGGC